MKTVFFVMLMSFLAVFCAFAPPARAQAVVIESFIAFDCEISYMKQPLVEMMVKERNAFFLNCHVEEPEGGVRYGQEYCSQKKSLYAVRDLLTEAQTPYSVINGLYKTAGAHPGIHLSGYDLAAKENPLQQVAMTLDGDVLAVELPQIDTQEDFDLWFYAYDYESDLAQLDDELTEQGEDQATRFINIVTKMDMIGRWNGTPETVSIPLKGYKADGFALIVQEHDGGAMHAIARIEPGMTAQQSRPQR